MGADDGVAGFSGVDCLSDDSAGAVGIQRMCIGLEELGDDWVALVSMK